MYKMVDISVETRIKAKVSVTNIHENDNANKTLLKLICVSHIAKGWGDKNIYDLIDKHSMQFHEDIVITIIMQSRLSDLERIKFRSDLGFNQINLILKKNKQY